MRQPLDWFPDRRGADFRRSPRACSTGNQGTYLSERLAMIQNLVTDLGIGRHMSDQEILDTLAETLRRQREERGPSAGRCR